MLTLRPTPNGYRSAVSAPELLPPRPSGPLARGAGSPSGWSHRRGENQRFHTAIGRRCPSSAQSGRAARLHQWSSTVPPEWLGVRGLLDPSSRTNAKAGRGDGQSRSTQAGRGRHRNRAARCPAPQSAAMFPDLNRIEMMFAKLKAALRKPAARSIETLFDAVAVAVAAFTAQQCLNFFATAGYDRA